MRFDWKQFCTRNKIAFVTSGANTAQGNISINCPWCGAADQSQHMGLSLNIATPYWGCFRNADHRGKHPAKLVSLLLGISFRAAVELVDSAAVSVDDFEDSILRLKGSDDPPFVPTRREVEIPAEFRDLLYHAGGYGERFVNYLHSRGFQSFTYELIQTYHLWYALTGEQAWRIIFPVTDFEFGDQLIGWTGRSIRNGELPRYLAMPGMSKDALLTFDNMLPAKAIAICEGPFDALKIDFFGRKHGVRAVATMGTAFTDSQIHALWRLQQQASQVWAIFDDDALSQNLRLIENMPRGTRPLWHRLPVGYDDPGALDAHNADLFCRSLANEGYTTRSII